MSFRRLPIIFFASYYFTVPKVYNSEGLFVRSFRVRADKAFVRLCKTLSEHPFGVLKCVRDGVLFDEGY